MNARSANRNNNAPSIRNNNLGLRPSKTSHCPIDRVDSGHATAAHVMSRSAAGAGEEPSLVEPFVPRRGS